MEILAGANADALLKRAINARVESLIVLQMIYEISYVARVQ